MKKLEKQYVRVRFTSVKGIDLNIFSFNYDLTFAIFFMNADGTIYHRYGTRDETSAISRMSIEGLTKVMKKALKDHKAYQKNPSPPKIRPKIHPKKIVETLPYMSQFKGKKCIHCHQIYEGKIKWAYRQSQRLSPKDVWKWPLPDQVGLMMDVNNPSFIQKVKKYSPASRAGLKKGDRILKMAGKSIFTQADIQYVLEKASLKSTKITVEYKRNATLKKAKIRLRSGWKKETPLQYSWRASVWSIPPQTGFWGGLVTPAELKKEGFSPKMFALKIGGIVNWEKCGRAVKRAGLKVGDLLLSVNGKRNFKSARHLAAWYSFKVRPGSKVRIKFMRKIRGRWRIFRIRVSVPR